MNRIFRLFPILCLSLVAFHAGATTSHKKKAVSKTQHAAAARHGSKSRTVASKRTRGKTRTPVQHSQAAPTPDRYREIQQALVDKGYLKSEPTGTWDAGSQDAMKRFQTDQKLDQTGKINARSLISLGLGPKH